MFDNLKKLEVQHMAWMDLPEVSPGARLQMKFAGDQNPGYFNAVLRLVSKRVRSLRKGDQHMAEQMNEMRENDRQLFPQYVIVGWEGIMDDQGQPVPFSRELAAEFAQKLPDWLFDRVRTFAAAPQNYLLEESPAPAEIVAGN